MLAYIYEDILASDFNRIAMDSNRRIRCQLPVRYIVFPAVPRTYDDLPLKLPFAQRTTPM